MRIGSGTQSAPAATVMVWVMSALGGLAMAAIGAYLPA